MSVISHHRSTATRDVVATRGHSLVALAPLAPLLLAEAYLTVTLLLFAFGPVASHHTPDYGVFLYLLVGQAAIGGGYLLGLNSRPRGYAGTPTAGRLLKTAILFQLLLIVPELLYRNYARVSLTEAIVDPGKAYHERHASDAGQEHVVVSMLLVALSPALVLLIPLGVVYWRAMSRRLRWLWLASIVGGIVVPAILAGTNKRLFDLVLPAPWLLYLGNYRGPLRAPQVASSFGPRGRRARPILTAAAVLALGLGYFGYSMYSRGMQAQSEIRDASIGWSRQYGIDLPPRLEHFVYHVCLYSSSGYDGLTGCLDLPYQCCYGAGNSPFLTRQLERLRFARPNELASWTYPARLESRTGYSADVNWHSIYPWIASDLTFPGALVFVGVAAFFLAQAWLDSLRGENPFAMAMLSLLTILWFYIPANNNVLQYGETLSGFWGTFLAWRWTRR